MMNGKTGALTYTSGATSTFASGLSTSYLNLTGTTATSTSAGTGFSIATGCYAIGANCLSFNNITGTAGAFQGGTGATSLSAAFGVNSNVFSNVVEHGFDYFATSTLWGSGTTTLHFLVTQTGTLIGTACRLFPSGPANLMNVQFGNGTASGTMMVASSTQGTTVNTFTQNVALTAGQTMYMDFGATSTVSYGASASTTADVACTWQERI
jgi:hypothetical protein